MTTYLEEAAAQLRKAAAEADKQMLSADRLPNRRWITEGFTRLAAIEKGLPADWPQADDVNVAAE
jgi:hypothetical protein